MAFNSVEHIMRDVNYGWLIRYLHMNGASMFFIVVYIHIFRGLYYGSYKAPRELLWLLGIVILILMMATAFMGYVLPWGQMSFWGATVITNLFSAIPLVGESVVTWLWGGFAVDNPTLNRFFSLHYLLPFVIVAVVMLHIIALHRFGSNNPLGIDMKGPQDSIPFHPYYTVKDMFGLGVFLIFYAGLVFFAPNFFGEPDNYIPANPLATPAEIVPEWYFLPYYAILRSIPNKLAGVIAMFGALALLALIPWLDRSPVKSARFRPLYRSVLLAAAGRLLPAGILRRPSAGRLVRHRLASRHTLLLLHFLVVLPLLALFERPKPLPRSIGEPVLQGGGMSCSAGQDDGEGMMRRWLWRRLATLPRRRQHGGHGRGSSAARRALVLRWHLRHLRPGGVASRLPGLSGRLLDLPFDEPAALSRPRRDRLFGRRDQGDRGQRPGARRARRQWRHQGSAGPSVRCVQGAVCERSSGAGREQRRVAAGSLAYRQGAQGRRRLHSCAADRLRRCASGREAGGRHELRQVFPRPSDRHASAAFPTIRSPSRTRRRQPSIRKRATLQHFLPGPRSPSSRNVTIPASRRSSI